MKQPVENALRAAFDRTTTGLDDNPTRFQEVAERFKRRRRRQAVGLAGVATVAALVAGWSAIGVGIAGRDLPAGPPTEPPIDCPTPVASGPTVAATPGTGPLVPEGAVAVRTCGELEVNLHRGVDQLVAALNALSPPEPELICEDIGGIRYDLVLAYPDGERVTVWIDTGSCGAAQVGNQIRIGSAGLTSRLLELAEEQRWAEAPTAPPAPGCPDPATLSRPVGDDETPPRYDAFRFTDQSVPYPAVAIAVCRYSSTDPATATLLTSKIVTDDVEHARELVNGQSPENPFWECEPPAGSWDVLVFADEAGGLYEVRLGRGDCKVFYSGAGVWLSDEPDPELRRWLDDTLGGPPPE